MFADKAGVPQGCRHEDVRLATASNQVADDLLTVADHVLGGSGFVIHITGVDLGALIEQEARDLNGAGEMKWGLTVPAGRVHQVRIGGDECAEVVEPAEARGGM